MAKKKQPPGMKLTRAMKVREDLMKKQERLQALNHARTQHQERQLGMHLENELSRITGDIGRLRNGHEIIRRHRLQDLPRDVGRGRRAAGWPRTASLARWPALEARRLQWFGPPCHGHQASGVCRPKERL